MGILDAPGAPRIATLRTARNIAGTGNVTLTATEAASRVLELTAATQTITVTVPTGACCRITNSTDFAQTLKRAGSTKTVTIESGGSLEVQS